MTSEERDLAADFRVLVETVLDRVEPMIRRLDSGEVGAKDWQGCSWCPLCALAAFMRGERHDLLTLAGSEIEQLLVLVREVLGEHGRAPHATEPVPPHPAASDSGEARRKRVYEPITVTVKE